MPLSPPYDIQPVTEDDVEACMESGAPAFHNDRLRMATFPPHLIDPSDPDEELNFRRRRMRKRLAENQGCHWKIVDPDRPSSIAAWASWVAPQKLDPDGGDKKIVADGADQNERPKCADQVVLDVQYKYMKESRERVFGESKDFWYLASLSCHPDYQRKGLGAALVQWGLEQAEKDGVPVYLEATPMGAFLYKKLGFEEVDEVDLTRFMLDGKEYKIVSMLKRPSNKA